jgi:PD-(D/E)XK nuclease superfamily
VTITAQETPGRDGDGEGSPEQNPMLGYRESLVRDWPGPARPDDTSPQFPDGWRRTAAAAIEAGAVQTALVDALEPDDREAFERLSAGRRQLAAHLREREAVEGGPSVERTPQAVGASDLITYTQCPKRFYWSRVRPLPRFSGPAARIGTEVHAWIERRARGQGQLLEIGDRPDLTDEELAGDPGRVERLRDSFLASRFADVAPLYAERAFLLRLGEFTVGGRIDAIFGEPDGPWEIVDWKTGRKPTADDPTLGLQLDVYGLAAVEIWGKAPSDLTLTYLYLASGDEVTKPMDDPALVRSRVETSLTAIRDGTFDPTPGRWCTHCDFRSFCDAGQAWLRANEV